MKMIRLFVMLVLALGLSGAVYAADQCPPEGKEKKEKKEKKEGDQGKKRGPGVSAENLFAKWDKDGNGSVSKEEFLANGRGAKERKEAAFARIDADSSGSISLEELKAAFEKRRAGGKDKDNGKGKGEGKGKGKENKES